MGIDLTYVSGTGPEGRIVEKDVLAFKPQEIAIPSDRKVKSVEPLSPLRKTIARRMTQSSHNPHITMITEIDMTEVVALRNQINSRSEKKGIRVSFNDIIVKAVADILERFPKFNATLVGNDLHILEEINIGVAMATDTGSNEISKSGQAGECYLISTKFLSQAGHFYHASGQQSSFGIITETKAIADTGSKCNDIFYARTEFNTSDVIISIDSE